MRKSLKMAIERGIHDPHLKLNSTVKLDLTASLRLVFFSPRFACDELVPSPPLRVSHAISPGSGFFQTSVASTQLRTAVYDDRPKIIPHSSRSSLLLRIVATNFLVKTKFDIDNLLIDVVLSCRMGTQIHSPCFSILPPLLPRFEFSLTLKHCCSRSRERCCTSPANLERARHNHPTISQHCSSRHTTAHNTN